MKIVTLTLVRGIPAGITKQLQYEYDLSGQLPGVEWKTLMYSTEPSTLPFVRQIPFLLRPLFLRNLYGWIVALRESRSADYVLMRYMPFDLFGMFLSPWMKNRVSVHHAIEPVELKVVRAGWKGCAASYLDVFAGFFVVSNSVAIFGVTREIAKYQNNRINIIKPIAVFPNGINVDCVDVSSDSRVAGEINAIFICQEFSKWQGLEKLLRDANNFQQTTEKRMRIHLIGELYPEQRKMVEDLSDPEIFVMHGKLCEKSYRELFAIADVGIGSLALEEEGLLEASTLKVREMLGSGIPVYSGHVDSALPLDFPFYKIDSRPTIKGLFEFASEMVGVDRSSVRSGSLPYISKKSAMLFAADYLKKFF